MKASNPHPLSENLHPATPLQTDAEENSDFHLDLRRLYYRLLRNWYLVLLGLLLGYVAARLYLRYTEDRYEVSALVQIQDEEEQGLSEVVIQPLGYQQDQSLETEIQMLKNRNLMLQVVDRLNLGTSVFADGRVRNSDLYGGQLPFEIETSEPAATAYGKMLSLNLIDIDRVAFGYEDRVDTFRLGLPFNSFLGKFRINRRFGAERPVRKNFLIQFRDPIRVARAYANRLSVRPRATTNLIEMSLIDAVPQRAADIISTTIAIYDSVTVGIKSESGNKTLTFIDDRIEEFNEDLSLVEQRAENFIRDNDLLVDITTNLTLELEEMRQTEQQMAEFRLQLLSIDNIAQFFQTEGNNYRLIPFATDLPNLNVSRLLEQYNTLLLERQALLATASADNPTVKLLDAPLSNLREDVLDAIANARRETLSVIEQLQEENEQILSRIRGVPGQRRQLLGIEREQQIKEQLYLYLLQKREETAITQAIKGSGIRIVEAPFNEGPVGSNSLLIYALALAVGLIVPVGGIALAELLDNSVKNAEDIQRITPTPVLGSVGESGDESRIVVEVGSRTAVAEMFRLLRTNLQFVGAGRRQQVLLITSSMSGEGKTFVSMNLGASLALANHRVLLVGLDLRRPKLESYIHASADGRTPGVTNYLTGNATLEEVITPVRDWGNLFYIPAGAIPPNPAELIMLPQVGAMFNTLKERFDYILIDTPPVGIVTDALLLNNIVDTTLYVVRQNVTKLQQLTIIDDIHKNKKLPHTSIILNGVSMGRGYGYNYGYGYGYGYGYYED